MIFTICLNAFLHFKCLKNELKGFLWKNRADRIDTKSTIFSLKNQRAGSSRLPQNKLISFVYLIKLCEILPSCYDKITELHLSV